jgi:hypothetical protein
MPTSKYHREQAKILASLALSTNDALKAEQFNLAAMEQLLRARSAGGANIDPPPPEGNTGKSSDRA